jgi:glycerophosphoryl diester phosphodiesterase
MRKRWLILGALALVIGGIALANASFWGRPSGELTLLAHRGVHPDFPTDGLTNETCTAARIYPLEHNLIENTLPSIAAGFEAGAYMVEVDIHPTTDGEFAVFHDWTLECRTNGEGVTREQTIDYLRTLDVGYGYTADGGQTFPLRGQGVGMMPTLREVLAAFPDKRFLINFKGPDPAEADQLLAYLEATPLANISRLSFYGAGPANRLREVRPDLRAVSRRSLMNCAKSYVLTGWFGNVGEACRNSIIFVPSNYGWVGWGWPDLFLARMQAANSEVYIVDAIRRGERAGLNGIDDAEAFSAVPRSWRGGVATDRIEIIGPLAEERRVQ